MSKVFIWANSDMDGAASTVLLGNIFPNMEYRHVFFGNFLEQYTKWVETNLENYEKVFIIGMVLDQTLVNKVDDPRVVFISDRGEKLNVFDSKLITEETTSCVRLIYNKFKDKVNFAITLKQLVLYVDDYNSYTLKFEDSLYLNAIYRKYRTNRFGEFVRRFWKGCDGFTFGELETAQHFFDEIDKEFESLDLYEGTFKNWKVLATFSKCSVNEISKKLIDTYDHDVIIVVNTDTNFVSFRKRIGSVANIQYMSENLCNGGCGEWAAGGNITPKFMEFTQKMKLL
jgi:hypothetical protein